MTLEQICVGVAMLNERQKAVLRALGLNRFNAGDKFTVEHVGSDVRVFAKRAGFCHKVRLGPGGRVISRDVWEG
jgi:hypothetical protein